MSQQDRLVQYDVPPVIAVIPSLIGPLHFLSFFPLLLLLHISLMVYLILRLPATSALGAEESCL